MTAARPEATLSLEFLGPWQAPAMYTPSTTVSTGRSLGWISLKNPSRPSGQLEDADQLLVLARDHAGDEHHEVGRDGQLLAAGEEVADRDDQAARTRRGPRPAARHRRTSGRRSRACATPCTSARTCRRSACRGTGGTGGPARRATPAGPMRRPSPRSSSASSTRCAPGSSVALAAADAVDVGDAPDRPAVVGERTRRRRRSAALNSGSVTTPSMP